jgi:KaiC/GvpD/RAD55 family RecA-like ATPase
MAKNDLVVNNPLRALGLEENAKGGVQSMGLVMARAGLGKTAILVQFALDCMLLGNKVLHVSIGETVDKTRSWYDDILSLLTDGER